VPSAAAPSAIVFDMDGTLVHTREAAWEIFHGVNARLDLGIDTREQFFDIFEHDLREGLVRWCGDTARADAALAAFMAGLRDSYAPHFVPGMVHVVQTLAAQATLFIISGNATSVVRRILERNGVATCFAHVFAGDVEPSKAVSLRRVLHDATYLRPRRCAPDYVEDGTPAAVQPGEVAIVTDTVGDVREGRAHGIRAIGVSWGMHSAADLLGAGAELVALWPEELLAALAAEPGLSCATGACATGHDDRPDAAGAAQQDGLARARAASAVRRGRSGAVDCGPPPAVHGTDRRSPADPDRELHDAVAAIVGGSGVVRRG
jgi:phosphoglycolate phosphatase